MMRQVAVLSAALLLFTAGAGAQNEPQMLSKSEIQSLNRKVQAWFAAELEYEAAESARDRRRRGDAARKAKEAFMKEWESKQRKGDVLASIADVRAVFANAFPYERVAASGELKLEKGEGDELVPEHFSVAPRTYDPREAYRTVVLLTPLAADGSGWVRAKDHFEATWATSGLVGDTLFAIPNLTPSDDFDTPINRDDPNADTIEFSRAKWILGSARGLRATYNVDYDRVFLDSSHGSGAFALRFATYFPQFFAGIVVRDPVDVSEQIRLGSLRGMPILLVSSAATKDACDALKKKLDALSPGSCTVIEGVGEHPFSGSQAAIDEWIGKQRRSLTPATVVIEPNHDQFNDAYWVKIGTAEPIANLPMDQRPRIEVVADRAANRIEVTARHISDFALLLNDDIVDLSKPFTVVVNGKATQEERTRDLRDMVDLMLRRRDSGYIFTAEFATTVAGSDGE
ncbi:MAG: hypothetical protein IPM29_15525 [Planctomycetes bacterium]|nr:hypothetical protein [Planctomycetota bacterium]